MSDIPIPISTDGPIPTQSEEFGSHNFEKKVPPKKKFTVQDDEQLCKSYLYIALDSVQGSEQKSDTFWSRISDHYHGSAIKPCLACSLADYKLGCWKICWDLIPRVLLGRDGNKLQPGALLQHLVETPEVDTKCSKKEDEEDIEEEDSGVYLAEISNTDEDEVSSQRPVGRKRAKGLEANTRDYTAHMERLYSSHSDYIRKGDERNTILREGLEFAHIKMESDNRHTMAMEREQAMKRQEEDVKILMTNLFSIEDPEDRQILLDIKKEIRKRGVGNEPTRVITAIASDVDVLNCNQRKNNKDIYIICF
ncbi:hypothetical protein PHYBLDRAFT_63734 [Phycomyces blakesleeanus NRRL 1555(-)]|uniref:No apical meristem-associated C-terminal domain-containing protein n=1 Tax=Phycomyces blakesleeanus (strain ATCC 8743b / DSM 1359 / FGSC 10004 / NBRC 33097 / NRRL 1555) TaxID=763407 RepID=A0A167K4K4_PHYB8|nr:hypothetical protein PHYBLDRAFT_63734 [Phycomyces blakesleeanus NRRL 1555(-)]OAD67269.1 hypothetical protein PHYBLDRAFT_63734 [Phycomyces blakesleeanus NRRL 1555(-)]|eukprot:XP_018285309.1 hypothetical protein PHYBLDRAFT_63734 [Phycomyces blakesleeanus NRRL 1555(-)]